LSYIAGPDIPISLAASLGAANAIPSILSRCRIHLTYAWRHHRLPSIRDPRLFTELIQHRKLHDRDPRFPQLADKVLAKEYVAAALGHEWIIPTLWQGIDLPEIAPWPMPFVVKSRHGCNQRVFVRSPDTDWVKVRQLASRWMRSPYGKWLDEWLYTRISRGIIVEPLVGSSGYLPIDYKMYVFGGRVAFIQVHLDREHNHRWILLDRDWRRADGVSDGPTRPTSVGRMIAAAETLGANFPFVRIDFYDVDGLPKFGEMTFYPGSGLDPFDPPEVDRKMGDMWRLALTDATFAASESTPSYLDGDRRASGHLV
jgi:TupA-like ATPgrasp